MAVLAHAVTPYLSVDWVAHASPVCGFQDKTGDVDPCGPVSYCDLLDDLRMCYFTNSDSHPGDYLLAS